MSSTTNTRLGIRCRAHQIRYRGVATTHRARCFAQKDSKPDGYLQRKHVTAEGSSLQLKAAWYGAELFGKIMGGESKQEKADIPLQDITWDQAMQEIRADFDNNYFVSGDAEMLAYDPQCLFADPFTSFRGVDRFKQNLGNFSKFTSDVKCEVTGWEEIENGKLKVSWRFNCILELPWRPLLAAAGSTTYIGDAKSGRIVEHIEAWDVEPEKVLKRLVKPSKANAAEDGTAVEKFMDAAYTGDFRKGWSVSALPLLFVFLPDAVLTSGANYVFQDGWIGSLLFALQVSLWGICGACAVTVAANWVQGLKK